jgi:2-polyprenyl-6-hydroxyphenyl methylase / 3-demethylubiquinone-9 3-methyltransferase
MEYNNLDNEEINKFSRSYHHWWDKDGIFKTLHDINPVRIEYITSFADLDQQSVLDIGCGGGILATAMAQQGAKVTAIDKATQALDAAREQQQRAKLDIDYREITLEELADTTSKQYDYITCLELLEHIPQPGSIITSAMSLLKPGGKIFLSTLNRHPLAYVGGILIAEHLLDLIPTGTHNYHKFIKPAELATWLEDSGARIDDISGLSYNPCTRDASLTSNVKVNYLVCASKPVLVA